MKRSNKPIFWALFGAGGMLSALIAPMLVLLTGIAAPLGWLPAETLQYERVLGFVQGAIGKLAVFFVISLFLFHGMHRLYHTLHDFGVHVSRGGKALCHGLAFAGTLLTAFLLLSLGRG